MNVLEKTSLNVFDLYSTMFSNRVLLIYQGLFDQQMIKTVLSMTEMKLVKENVNENVKKKVFNIMMEGLQNICKHQFIKDETSHNPMLLISRDDNHHHIFTGNTIHNSKIELVSSKIEQVNGLDKDGLKELYKKARLNSVISEVGGAGLGFIDMARKSENPLEYRFFPINENYSFFILQVKISNQ
jgi:hypothetical protein